MKNVQNIIVLPVPPRYTVADVGYLCVDTYNKKLFIYDDVGNYKEIGTSGATGNYLQNICINGKLGTVNNNIASITLSAMSETDPIFTSVSSNIVFKNDNVSLLTNDAGYLTQQVEPKYTAASSNIVFKNDNVSLLTNDAGYISSQTDPVFAGVSSNFVLMSQVEQLVSSYFFSLLRNISPGCLYWNGSTLSSYIVTTCDE